MCEICKRIELIKQGKEKYFIKEYDTGYLSLFDNQAYSGYCLFIKKEHIEEIWETSYQYFNELAGVAEKLNDLYKPKKMNVCFLGNGCRHLHAHIIPNNECSRTIWHRNYRECFDYDVESIVNKIREVL